MGKLPESFFWTLVLYVDKHDWYGNLIEWFILGWGK